jgi:DNA-binding HxlR family transcriptional regulator
VHILIVGRPLRKGEEGTFMSTDSAGTVVTVQAYESCAVTRVLRRIGDKWSPAVIRLLAEHDYGFNELDRSIEGISRRMLTRTLRALEEEGFVSRTSGGPPPAAVRYALTDLGRSLREQLHTLGRWADAHNVGLPAADGARRIAGMSGSLRAD